jgi:hypothetical protein
VAEWPIKIVGYGEEDPTQLLANPRNWRVHPKAQREVLRGVLRETGWTAPVMVNKVTGHVVDGHARIEEAIKADQARVPVVYLELTEEQEIRELATHDPIAEMAVADEAVLNALIAEAQTTDDATRRLLDALATSEKDSRRGADVGEVPFTEILGEQQNYVVLTFDSEVDWLHACAVLDLQTVKATHARPGYESKGIGRVISGVEAMRKIRVAP